MVTPPEHIHEPLAEYGDLFTFNLERRHFTAIATDLRFAERKTATAINHQFGITTHHSCSNRFLSAALRFVQRLMNRRLALQHLYSRYRWDGM
jgi:hypothetical protein